ncbi:T9SS type A sorting domain-containing protein [Subsaxibacter sp. CAU 1640]|uniref:T9SS type A sorting domain-containing protein n=1 Tax=Subsaxibacter sp. CAU 1640 TaxID=2933271 RepID=UPI00200516D8|nr:T9SS type A sorting domain-containing protein [Subsaxibacter sp. CAU 1640]MCK7590744.1 T9SS type A sorting domain-containing protein [Subsaxibacter sp. CAU 1640]
MKKTILILIHLFLTKIIYAQVCQLDFTFGSNGIVITDIYNSGSRDEAFSVILTENETKILAIGRTFTSSENIDIALVQYNLDGSLDTSFGTNGQVIMDLSGNMDVANSALLQADNKILIVGETTNAHRDLFVARLHPDGALDTSFGVNGIFIYDNGYRNIGKKLAFTPDNKIMVGGEVNSNYALLRLTSDGNLDTTFNADGIVTTDLNAPTSEWNEMHDMIIQPDGKILVGGESQLIENCEDYYYTDRALLRYNTNGVLDWTFGNGGVIYGSYLGACGYNDTIQSINLLPDGKIITVGYLFNYYISGSYYVAVQKFNSNGTLDTGFGTNGSTYLNNFGEGNDSTIQRGEGNDSIIQEDGKIIIAGYYTYSSPTLPLQANFRLFRLDSNGAFDNTFGNVNASYATVDTDINNNSYDICTSLLRQSNDKLILAGSTRPNYPSSNYDFTLARYIVSDALGTPDNLTDNPYYTVYPNPFSNNIKLKGVSTLDTFVNIEICSAEGKKVKTITNYNLQNELDLSSFKNGIYFLKIYNQSGIQVIKIIKY